MTAPAAICHPYRVAIRAEGAMINAYFAPTHTMEGAQLVACIGRDVCEADRRVFEIFQQLMAMVSAIKVHALTGEMPIDVEYRDAPEHERAGQA